MHGWSKKRLYTKKLWQLQRVPNPIQKSLILDYSDTARLAGSAWFVARSTAAGTSTSTWWPTTQLLDTKWPSARLTSQSANSCFSFEESLALSLTCNWLRLILRLTLAMSITRLYTGHWPSYSLKLHEWFFYVPMKNLNSCLVLIYSPSTKLNEC